jgi:hypothetical protein
MYYICTMNYALIDLEGHTIMEFHTEEEAMMYGKRLAINTKEDVSIYKRIADINYKEKLDINVYGD